MCLLCRLLVAKKTQFLANFDISGATPFTDEGRIWWATAEARSTLKAKFHQNVFIVSASGGQKPQFWANFGILGAPVPTQFWGACAPVVAPMG